MGDDCEGNTVETRRGFFFNCYNLWSTNSKIQSVFRLQRGISSQDLWPTLT